MSFSREGWLVVLVALGATVVAYQVCGAWCAAPLALLALGLAFLFREPSRSVPPAPLGVVSPVDGRVTEVVPTQDPYLARDALRVQLRMHWYGPFPTRGPIEGKVVQQWYLPRGFLDSESLPHKGINAVQQPAPGMPRYAMWIQTDEADDVVMVVRGRYISHRMFCYVQPGERVGQGQRCGFVRFTSDVEVYLPATSRVQVAAGDRIKAGSDIIGTLVRKPTDSTSVTEATVST